VDVTAADIRALVNRNVDGKCVTTVYLNTDGARFPRASDYEARLDALLRQVRRDAERLDEARCAGVGADIEAIRGWVRSQFNRSDTRGLCLFASGGDIFETVQVALPVRNLARVADTPYVVPLEALLGRHHHIALTVIERNKARIFRYRLGRLEEYFGLESDVHGQHKQGGWSAPGYQKNIDNEVLHHFKEADEILRRAHEDQPFDALVIAGPQAEAAEFSRTLHPYLDKIKHGDPVAVELHASSKELTELLTGVEQELVSARRSALLQRLAASSGQGEKAARGLRHVLEAVNGKKVEVLFVVEGAGEPGYRSSTGALALREDEAKSYGGEVEAVDDVIDEIIEEAVRANAHIELFRDEVRLDGHPVAALLRF